MIRIFPVDTTLACSDSTTCTENLELINMCMHIYVCRSVLILKKMFKDPDISAFLKVDVSIYQLLCVYVLCAMFC